jgi:hypothetical protein
VEEADEDDGDWEKALFPRAGLPVDEEALVADGVVGIRMEGEVGTRNGLAGVLP